MGWLRDRSGSYASGLLVMAAFLALSTVLAWSLKLVVTRE